MGCDADEKGLGKGPSLLKRDGTIVCGLLEHGQKPHDDMLRHGLACAECASVVTKQFLAFWMFRPAV